MAEYTAINVFPPAREDLRRFAAFVGGDLGQRVIMSDALRLAVRIATDHRADVRTASVALGIIQEESPR